MGAAFRDDDGALVVEVQVVPRSARDRIGPLVSLPDGERVKVQLTAPPVDGAANEALVVLVAKALGVAKRAVAIVRGETGRKKTLRVEGARAAAFARLLAGAA